MKDKDRVLNIINLLKYSLEEIAWDRSSEKPITHGRVYDGDVEESAEDLGSWIDSLTPEDIGTQLHNDINEIKLLLDSKGGTEHMEFWTTSVVYDQLWAAIRSKCISCLAELNRLEK